MEILKAISKPDTVIPDEEGYKGVVLPPNEIRDLLMGSLGIFGIWRSRLSEEKRFCGRDDETGF